MKTNDKAVDDMGKVIELTVSDGHTLGAYQANPTGDTKGGVVVIQEIFGINRHVRDVCERLADNGYVAIAPALFDRIKPSVELGYTEDDLSTGFGYMQEVGNENPMKDIQAAADALRDGGKIATIGFCWGGQLAWLASKNVRLDCSVCYYGVAVHETLEPPPKCPVLLHFADNDVFVPQESADKVRETYPDMPIYSYPANHGFNCDRRDDFNEACANKAMERTLDFFEKNLS